MHDWTLVSVSLNWDGAKLEIGVLDDLSAKRCLMFEGVRDVSVERRQPWGPSNSINEVSVIHALDQGHGVFTVRFEMQSGDGINVTAESCELDQVKYSF